MDANSRVHRICVTASIVAVLTLSLLSAVPVSAQVSASWEETCVRIWQQSDPQRAGLPQFQQGYTDCLDYTEEAHQRHCAVEASGSYVRYTECVSRGRAWAQSMRQLVESTVLDIIGEDVAQPPPAAAPREGPAAHSSGSLQYGYIERVLGFNEIAIIALQDGSIWVTTPRLGCIGTFLLDGQSVIVESLPTSYLGSIPLRLYPRVGTGEGCHLTNQMQAGSYRVVNVERRGRDIYEVDGSLFRTSGCAEYASGEEAVVYSSVAISGST